MVLGPQEGEENIKPLNIDGNLDYIKAAYNSRANLASSSNHVTKEKMLENFIKSFETAQSSFEENFNGENFEECKKNIQEMRRLFESASNLINKKIKEKIEKGIEGYTYRLRAGMNGIEYNPYLIKESLETLGLKVGETNEGVKKQYRRLAMIYHPDRTKGDKEKEEKFKKIKAAYEYLRIIFGIK